MRNILILSGPSGCGKSTLIGMLLAEFPELQFSVSHTTRAPRPGETEGKDYYFVSDDRFDRMARAGSFAEWAEVHGQRYGTSWQEIRAKSGKGRILLLDIDSQGARSIKRRFPEAMGIFIVPPTLAALKKRLQKRQTKIDREARQRLVAAVKEIRTYRSYDYVVVNDELASALSDLSCLVVAFQHQAARSRGTIQTLLRGKP